MGTHKTLINGTAYKISGGKAMVGGTVHKIKKGRAFGAGTAFDVSFSNVETYTVYVYDGASMTSLSYYISDSAGTQIYSKSLNGADASPATDETTITSEDSITFTMKYDGGTGKIVLNGSQVATTPSKAAGSYTIKPVTGNIRAEISANSSNTLNITMEG